MRDARATELAETPFPVRYRALGLPHCGDIWPIALGTHSPSRAREIYLTIISAHPLRTLPVCVVRMDCYRGDHGSGCVLDIHDCGLKPVGLFLGSEYKRDSHDRLLLDTEFRQAKR
jgi:hypothetical protein